LNGDNIDHVEIIKEGDETFELLRGCDVFVTVSSTMILDALLMDKECIVVRYLAGEERLEYDSYECSYFVDSAQEISRVVQESINSKKPYEKKRRLLEGELLLLDGRAGNRAAAALEGLCHEIRATDTNSKFA
jgi:hypothetical protein